MPDYYSLIPGTTGATLTDNRIYAGVKWTLNEGIKPQAVVGYRHARTESNGDTDGGDVSISAKIFDGFQLGKLRELNTLMAKKIPREKLVLAMTLLKDYLLGLVFMRLTL